MRSHHFDDDDDDLFRNIEDANCSSVIVEPKTNSKKSTGNVDWIEDGDDDLFAKLQF